MCLEKQWSTLTHCRLIIALRSETLTWICWKRLWASLPMGTSKQRTPATWQNSTSSRYWLVGLLAWWASTRAFHHAQFFLDRGDGRGFRNHVTCCTLAFIFPLQVFRLSQLIIEYLLYVQDCLQSTNAHLQQHRCVCKSVCLCLCACVYTCILRLSVYVCWARVCICMSLNQTGWCIRHWSCDSCWWLTCVIMPCSAPLEFPPSVRLDQKSHWPKMSLSKSFASCLSSCKRSQPKNAPMFNLAHA